MKILLYPCELQWIMLLMISTEYNYIYKTFDNIINNKVNNIILIPKDDSFALFLCKNKEKISNNNYKFMTCDNIGTIENLSNKVNLSRNKLQKYLPETYSMNNITYPCILKYSTGEHSNGVFKINNKLELQEKITNKIINKDYILQEAIINKNEYSTQFLLYNGKIVFHASYYDEYEDDLFIWPYGTSKKRVNFKLNETSFIFNIFKKFFINYNGLINCNYKIVNNKLKILEFNPRLSGDIFYIEKYELKQLINLYCKYSCKKD